MGYIFISYSSENINFARHLRELLEATGFNVWMDETSLMPSQQWWSTIEKHIMGCDAFLVIMSPEAKESDWVEREILIAEKREHRKPIFPILYSGEVWSRLGNLQYADLTGRAKSELPANLIEGLKAVGVIPQQQLVTIDFDIKSEERSLQIEMNDGKQSKRIYMREKSQVMALPGHYTMQAIIYVLMEKPGKIFGMGDWIPGDKYEEERSSQILAVDFDEGNQYSFECGVSSYGGSTSPYIKPLEKRSTT